MNKLLIVVLAICLVSVHAFVKRDAETTTENYLETIQQKIREGAAQIQTGVAENLNPEAIKKGFNEAIDALNKALENLKSKSEAPKAA